ncbi:RING finger protein 215 isoform X2 [Takifugu flavidus]|uniref:RING finger protein 215 n=1 Tax=Takifugu flavidus TaxID=433684 RepID=A0A5C6MYJ3_9TELE|nr:RING finger protein 215 isoform X2 [Takifugu flavidus]TWW60146.1 RING finger protein 215 [Takifugu flavidus]
MRFFYILTSFPGYFVSVSVRKMSSTRALYLLWVTLSLLLLRCPGLTLLLLEAEEVALVEVYLEQPPHVSALLHGQVVESSRDRDSGSIEHQDHDRETLEGELVLVQDEEMESNGGKDQEPWIGVVPVDMDDSKASTGNQESFADTMVNKMKRALVLGASALIILALNQNTMSETDLSQVLSKPIIVIQTSENVTKLIGALLRGLEATAKITYKTILQENLGATLTLWSSCGRSRGGRYGEWQGVICTGETNSPVQKYLQQLWDTVLLVALILSTGVIVQARWQHQGPQLNDDLELQLLPKQDILKRMSSLRTKVYRQPKLWRDSSQPLEADNCAVCLEPFHNNQCLRVLPCLHEYHRECVDPWLLLQHTCPLCKRSIFSESQQSNPSSADIPWQFKSQKQRLQRQLTLASARSAAALSDHLRHPLFLGDTPIALLFVTSDVRIHVEDYGSKTKQPSNCSWTVLEPGLMSDVQVGVPGLACSLTL